MWESSDLLVLSRNSNVLPSPSIKLGLILTVFNTLLWLVATILQAILIGNIEYSSAPTSYTLVGICLGWSVVIFIITAGSVYGLIRNTVKDIKSYLVLTACTTFFSFIIFVICEVVLSFDTVTEDWFAPAGFSVFTGLYVTGESSLIIWYFTSQWKEFKTEVEVERLDRMQQRMREQQQQHLSFLSNTTQSAPPFENNAEQVIEVVSEAGEEITNESDDEKSEADSDRLTYYPPVFV